MASTISGNTVTIASGGDTNVLGSNVAATNGLAFAIRDSGADEFQHVPQRLQSQSNRMKLQYTMVIT